MKLSINGKVMTIKSIEANHRKINEAREGDSVGIMLTGGNYRFLKSLINREVVFGEVVNDAIIETKRDFREKSALALKRFPSLFGRRKNKEELWYNREEGN